MSSRPLHRAMALAIAGLFVFAGVASADNARADGDAVGLQSIIDVGPVAPGAIVPVNVNFELVCASSNHVDVGQTVNLAFAVQSAAPGGAVVSATNATIGPVPAGWPADGDPCDVPAQILTGTSATVVRRCLTVKRPPNFSGSSESARTSRLPSCPESSS